MAVFRIFLSIILSHSFISFSICFIANRFCMWFFLIRLGVSSFFCQVLFRDGCIYGILVHYLVLFVYFFLLLFHSESVLYVVFLDSGRRHFHWLNIPSTTERTKTTA